MVIRKLEHIHSNVKPSSHITTGKLNYLWGRGVGIYRGDKIWVVGMSKKGGKHILIRGKGRGGKNNNWPLSGKHFLWFSGIFATFSFREKREKNMTLRGGHLFFCVRFRRANNFLRFFFNFSFTFFTMGHHKSLFKLIHDICDNFCMNADYPCFINNDASLIKWLSMPWGTVLDYIHLSV